MANLPAYPPRCIYACSRNTSHHRAAAGSLMNRLSHFRSDCLAPVCLWVTMAPHSRGKRWEQKA